MPRGLRYLARNGCNSLRQFASRAMLFAPVILSAQVNVLTWHNDNARTGQNLQETTLTPANVNASSFGKLFTIPTDGKVDAQPLSFNNVLYVASEHDSVYAFNANSGTL